MNGMSYFASDGSYGDADDAVIVDTSKWCEDDWNEIVWAHDSERAKVAMRISKRKK